jgi:hypothetical protein
VADSTQRGSDRHSARQEDERKRELQGYLRSGHPTRAEEWNDPEPGADDDPALAGRPVPPTRPGGDPEEAAAEELRSDLARHLGRGPFPGGREALLAALEERHAPDPLVATVRELPPDGGPYRNVQGVMEALGRAPRS